MTGLKAGFFWQFNKVDQEKRYQELIKKCEWAREKLDRAKKALGAGSWHEDSTYELADQEFRVWSTYIEDIEKELKELRERLKKKNRICGPEV